MIDASHCKVHPHAAGARGGNQDMSRTKGGLNIKLHLAPGLRRGRLRCAWHADQGYCYMKVRPADCKQAIPLIEGIDAHYLFADRDYDSNAIVDYAHNQGMIAIIPPRKNRKNQRHYDKNLYKLRHLVENAFLHLKRGRGCLILALLYTNTVIPINYEDYNEKKYFIFCFSNTINVRRGHGR
jgi:transposase